MSSLSIRILGKPVEDSQIGGRVDRYLSENYLFFSRAGWQKKIKSSMVFVNSSPVKGSYKLKLGDQLSYMYPAEDEPEVDKNIFLIAEHDEVMAIYKPGYLPMHENGPWKRNTFAQLLIDQFGEGCAAVHRLDRETSGIVLCSKNSELRKKLSQQWVDGEVEKEYLAICNGVPQEDYFEVDAPIGDAIGSSIRIKKAVNPEGLESLTKFMVEKRAEKFSFIRAFPKTGRTNQIRVHLEHAGHLIVGDKMYHPDESVFNEYYEKGDGPWISERTGYYRHLLHAAKISYTHPRSRKRITISCDAPEDMLEKWKEISTPC